MFENFSVEMWHLLRILIAFALGFVIGLERKIRYKEAGIRTHAIVSGGAALMVIISKYGFTDVGGDGSRVAAQVVTGIGFLGAGLIMYRRDSLRGVTTAAGIWATAAVGMAAGTGQYIVAVGTAALIIAIQCLLHLRIPLFQTKRFYIYRIRFVATRTDDETITVKNLFGVSHYSRINYYNQNGSICATAEISTKNTVSDVEIKKIMFDNEFIMSVERVYQLDGKE